MVRVRTGIHMQARCLVSSHHCDKLRQNKWIEQQVHNLEYAKFGPLSDGLYGREMHGTRQSWVSLGDLWRKWVWLGMSGDQRSDQDFYWLFRTQNESLVLRQRCLAHGRFRSWLVRLRPSHCPSDSYLYRRLLSATTLHQQRVSRTKVRWHLNKPR